MNETQSPPLQNPVNTDKVKLPYFDYLAVECIFHFPDREQFYLQVERDITANTLPTYPYLRQLARQQRVASITAMLETATIELLSKLRLMNYIYMTSKNRGNVCLVGNKLSVIRRSGIKKRLIN